MKTPTILELADRSPIIAQGIIEDIIIPVDSWEYLAYFYVLQPRSQNGGHLLILGRPWLAITDA